MDAEGLSNQARTSSALFFAQSDYLGQQLPGYRHRPEQSDYAHQVQQAIDLQQPLFIEAGTGTGKTIGYLVPAIQSGLKVLLSTGTKTLQDQLYLKDLPLALKLLDSSAKVALLKGRSNYLCLHQLERLRREPVGLLPADMKGLNGLDPWLAKTDSGVLSESPLADNTRVLGQLTASSEHCVGRECALWDECFLVKARNQAQKADIVIINHHLLCADLHLRGEQMIEIMPSADVVICDEAHQLPKIITDFFSDQFSIRQLQRMASEATTIVTTDVAEGTALLTTLREIGQALVILQQTLSRFPGRWAWEQILVAPELLVAITELFEQWRSLSQEIGGHRKASADLERIHDRIAQMVQLMQRFLSDNHPSTSGNNTETVDVSTDQKGIRWIEIATKNSRWVFTPTNSGELFSRSLQNLVSTPIFTSATLESGGNFDHIKQSLGLPEASTVQIASPYRLDQQMLRFAFDALPEPSDPLYLEKALTQLLPLFDATEGRAFLLMTSHRDIQRAEQFFDHNPLGQTVLYQGKAPKNLLLNQFREDGNAVLVGTQSFWEGIDIRGAALSCVVIAKLPFAPPDDPVLQAKSTAIRAKGGNPFMQLQLPEAIILFKQGIGRLIRDETDKGILAIADPRVRTKRYGQQFLQIVAAAPETADLDAIIRFLD